MAILIPASCVRCTVPSRAQGRMRVSSSANQLNFRRDSVDWVQETSSFFEEDKRPIMLFDGVCNLCNGGVKFVRDHDRKRSIRFEALQSEAGKKLLMRSGRAPDDISSVVLVEKDRYMFQYELKNGTLPDIKLVIVVCILRAYLKSEAVLKIMNYIDLPFPQLAFFIQFAPLFVRDFMYDNIANNRYAMFGRSDSCEI